MSRDATTLDEFPLYVQAGNEHVFAMVTRPTGEANGTAVVLLSGGAFTPATGRNRLWVRLARRLSGSGYHVVRMDYHGVGESTGFVGHFRLDEPFPEDVVAVVRWLEEQRLERFYVIGTCFGARTALAAAPQVERLEGVLLFAPPVLDLAELPVADLARRATNLRVLSGLLDKKRRRHYIEVLRKKLAQVMPNDQRTVGRSRAPSRSVSRKYLRPLEALVDRQVPILLVYGDSDPDVSEDFERARTTDLAPVFQRAGSRLQLEIVEGRLHALNTSRAQENVIELVTQWLAAQRSRPGAGVSELR